MSEHCTGKKAYGSYRAATHAMRLIRKGSSRHEVPSRVYKCGSCGNWHLTSSQDGFKESNVRKQKWTRSRR